MAEQKETKLGRLIITTTGTSALNGDKLDRLHLTPAWQDLQRSQQRTYAANRHQVWIEQELPRAIACFRDAYLKAATNWDLEEEKEKPRRGGTNAFSAELTSLYVMKLRADQDRITLFLSDSFEGVISGLLVQILLSELFSLTPAMRIVEGLQVENFDQFFKTGLQRFANAVTNCIESFPNHTPVLNVTGGFKSLIPYATYVALAHDMELYFSFEEQPEPIVINPKEWPESMRQKAQPFQQFLRQEQGMLPHPLVEP
jgi:hypothetical protein